MNSQYIIDLTRIHKKELDYKNKEIEFLKKVLDDNNIKYEVPKFTSMSLE